jgi:hypothetical protein
VRDACRDAPGDLGDRETTQRVADEHEALVAGLVGAAQHGVREVG